MDQVSDGPAPRSVVGDQLRAVRRRWRLIALVAALAVVASFAHFLLRVPEYRATAEVLLSATAYDVQRGGAELTPEEIATQVRVATSRPVADLVREDLRLETTPSLEDLVTVEALGNSRVLRFTARTSHPDEAAEIARSVASSYLTFRQTNTQQTLSEVTGALTKRQQQLETALDQLDDTSNRGRPGPGAAAEQRNLESQLGQVTTQLASLDIAVTSGAGGELLNRPEETATQVAPRPLLNGVLALLIGLLAGLALALTRDRFDDVAHDEDDLLPALVPAAVLGRVPRWRATSPEDRLVTVTRPGSASSQAFQELVARIRFLVREMPQTTGRGAVLMCTSAHADEGKSDVAVNLAVAAAKVGMRVVLVDADLHRRPGDRLEGLPVAEAGLSDVLATGRSVERLLVRGPVENLTVLPAGTTPGHPGSMIASARMRPIVAALAEQVDLVVVDVAATADSADALEVAGVVDVTVLVAVLGRSRRSAVRASVERLYDVGAGSPGAVVIGGPATDDRRRLPSTGHLGRWSGPTAKAERPRDGVANANADADADADILSVHDEQDTRVRQSPRG